MQGRAGAQSRKAGLLPRKFRARVPRPIRDLRPYPSDLLRDFARKTVALGGTVSAEHGLGKRKRHLLELQYSADIEKMRAVKRRLDPANIPGRGTPL